MSEGYTEEQAVSAVRLLTVTRLRMFVETECVIPTRAGGGHARFSDADLARMELLCELTEDFDLDEDALGLVMALIDQLHGLRHELRALAGAVSAEPAEVRARIRDAYHSASGG